MTTVDVEILAGDDAAAAHQGCVPTGVDVTLTTVFKQVGRDLFDKEVQSAATYSYLWIADQMGHIGLGLVIVFALSWISAAAGLAGTLDGWLPAIAGIAVVCIWETKAYVAYAGDWTKLFPLDRKLLALNAGTAALYMAIGVVLGFFWQKPPAIAASATVLAAALAVGLGVPWLRQKIVWQKAGLPFLFRLSNAKMTIALESAEKLDDLLRRYLRCPPATRSACGPIVILTGAIHAGKTSLACGIGTECAFQRAKVRYTTFDKLAQMAATDDDTGPPNIEYWRWRESEILIIDDVQSGSRLRPHRDLARFKREVKDDFGPLFSCVGRRMSVWVLGPLPPSELRRWESEIAEACAGASGAKPEVLTIRFMSPTADAPMIDPEPTD
jgi:hypothetical protein